MFQNDKYFRWCVELQSMVLPAGRFRSSFSFPAIKLTWYSVRPLLEKRKRTFLGLPSLCNCTHTGKAAVASWPQGGGRRSLSRTGELKIIGLNFFLQIFQCHNFDLVDNFIFCFREKQEIIDSLIDPDHEYVSFFVCRNPVAKLVRTNTNTKDNFLLKVSIYNYHKALSSSSYRGPHGPHKDIIGKLVLKFYPLHYDAAIPI